MRVEEMKLINDTDFRIVQPKEKREIEKFASWFHQDWMLVYPSFDVGASQYINNLTTKEKTALKRELEAFVEENKESDKKKWLSAWLKLGAQGWERGKNFKDMMNTFVSICKQD